MRSAEQDPVGTRKHIQIVVRDGAVLDLGLRQQERQLAFYRDKFCVSEQRPRSQSRAVHNHSLREALQLGDIVNLANLDMSARDLEISHQRRKITVRFDQHGVELTYKFVRKRILASIQLVRFGEEVVNWAAGATQATIAERIVAHLISG